jgi:gamma-glutamyltranspeptidase
MPNEWVEAMKTRGHSVEKGGRAWGNMQGVYFDKRDGTATPYNDPRGKAGILF